MYICITRDLVDYRPPGFTLGFGGSINKLNPTKLGYYLMVVSEYCRGNMLHIIPIFYASFIYIINTKTSLLVNEKKGDVGMTKYFSKKYGNKG